jgi:hypothetical protein
MVLRAISECRPGPCRPLPRLATATVRPPGTRLSCTARSRVLLLFAAACDGLVVRQDRRGFALLRRPRSAG